MSDRFKDREHLFRMAALFAVGCTLFFVARGVLTPRGFGEYGHYRAGALDDNRSHPMMFAGRAACGECHEDIVKARSGSKHARIGCEACHGALAGHAADPEQVKATKPDAKPLCLTCHRTNVARPATFPQIDPAEHGDGEVCTECHNPHHPEP